VKLERTDHETAVDRFGNLIVNADPEMKSFAPDGALRWSFPNRWVGVHGSHAAPLPEVGVMQGALFFLGMAPLDAHSDVFVLNGNHGRFFVLTSDGLYLDEMFKDVRTGSTVDAYLIGGECFGGVFGQSTKDGHYYLQSGHTDYRLFRLNGLREIRRAQGTLVVSAAQAAAADSVRLRQLAETQPSKEARIPRTTQPIVVDGRDTEWPKAPTVSWDKSRQYPVQVRLQYDAEMLYLSYLIDDTSPWVNGGKNWTALFKTGDSVNLELGTNPNANPKRSGPVPGDLRLLMAPFNGQPIAVLYRHRVPGATEPVQFTSPWRAETVDVVKRLDSATIAVTKEAARYRLEAAIPLADLGLRQPAGQTLKADFGVIYGDADGAITMLRSYWANGHTNLVNDVPGEIMLTPHLWGTVTFVGGEN
jgi:hypothetical protein